MAVLSRWSGPESKLDRTLPYTYEARVDALGGQGSAPIPESYFADTICGLIDHLDALDIPPAQVELFGVYRKEQIPLDVSVCTDAEGRWLSRPGVCRALEAHYRETGDPRYRGHVDRGACAYEDREREGMGPY